MNLQDQKERNLTALKGLEYLNKHCGLRWNFIASQIDMSYHSFAPWKSGKYMLGKERLKKVEALIEKYKNMP